MYEFYDATQQLLDRWQRNFVKTFMVMNCNNFSQHYHLAGPPTEPLKRSGEWALPKSALLRPRHVGLRPLSLLLYINTWTSSLVALSLMSWLVKLAVTLASWMSYALGAAFRADWEVGYDIIILVYSSWAALRQVKLSLWSLSKCLQNVIPIGLHRTSSAHQHILTC